jgi:ferritin-like metal-binding protein YciE
MREGSATEAHEHFVAALHVAQALEVQSLAVMKAQRAGFGRYRSLEHQIGDHIAETERQCQRLQEILERLGEEDREPSDGPGLTLNLGLLSGTDSVVGQAIAAFAFENYEIGTYQSLITLAKAAGCAEALPLLDATLREEQEMARWLDQNIADLTWAHLAAHRDTLVYG